MANTLSIRSYSTKPTSHSHEFHQLVLPLRGVISLKVADFDGKVAPGECVIVRAQQEHLFTANEKARFVVADMHTIPANLASYQGVVFAIRQSLATYLTFVEQQLQQQLNHALDKAIFDTFYLLLAEQILLPKLDNRIAAALMHIEHNIQDKLSIAQLAKIACLSPTQFKLLFKQQTGLSAMHYVSNLRIQKAQALLTNTDYPLQIIAEMVGYNNLSTFSRKFTQLVGLSPSKFKQ